MAKAVVVDWNGEDLPEQLRELPVGRYVLAPVEDDIELSADEEEGLRAALSSTAQGRVLPHDEVMERAQKFLRD